VSHAEKNRIGDSWGRAIAGGAVATFLFSAQSRHAAVVAAKTATCDKGENGYRKTNDTFEAQVERVCVAT